MTAAWFRVLREFYKKKLLPIQLFTIGYKFRREQRLDQTHLYESLTASIVIMDREISVEDGKNVVTKILNTIGFENVKAVKKEATSKYYAPGTEHEFFVFHPQSGKWIEIGDGGLYSPVSLSNYDIPYPVWNFGMGVERAFMCLFGGDDIRKVVYPYLYEAPIFTDEEISKSIHFIKQPKTEEGKKLVELIVRKSTEYANEPTPASIAIYSGNFLGKKVEIFVSKKEGGKKLLGPAALNFIVVENGNILGLPCNQIPKDCVNTGITYIDGISNLFVHELENAIENGEEELTLEIKEVKSLSRINIDLDENVREYIELNHKRIKILGSVFVCLSAKIYNQ